MKYAFALLVLIGTSFGGDYTYKDGYYWNNGVAYQRYSQPYWYNGCWHYRYQYYAVDFNRAYEKEVAEVYQSYTPEQQAAKLLELTELKLKYEHDREKQRIAAEEVRKGIEALGLSAPTTAAYTAPLNSAQVVQSGTTVYGYPSVNNVAGLYSDGVNLNTLTHAAQRTADNLAKIAGDSNAGIVQIVKEISKGRDDAAKILAVAQVLSASPTIQTTTVTGSQTAQTPAAVTSTQSTFSVDHIVTQKCAKCHSTTNAQGKSELFPNGVDMTTWRQFTAEQWDATVEAVLSGRMPQGQEALTKEEIRGFFTER